MLRQYAFKPQLLPTLATLVLLPILLSLGMWQWHRADYKRNLQKAYSEQSHTTALSLSQALHDPEGYRYFPLAISGHYLPERQFLLDNQFYQHLLGYHVLTPFVTDEGQILLVNRGWLPRRASTKLALDARPQQRLSGRLSTPPKTTFLLGENITPSQHWPKTVQAIKLRDLSRSLGKPIEPVILLLSPSEEDGFSRDWHPRGLTSEKHLGYALQWFALAALLIGLYIVLNLKKRLPTS